MEAEKAELKSILRGLLISSPKQMTVRELANDFSKQEGREFPFQKYGFRTFVDYLRTIKDTVVLSGFQPIYVTPVVKESTAHVNDLVLKQKSTSSRKSSYKALEKSQRKRGWVPIVIPPDPPKTLPTLLDIKIPSRNKCILNAPATRRTTRNSANHSLQKLKVDSGHKNVDDAKISKNYASVVHESQENIFPDAQSEKKAYMCNGLDNKVNTVACETSEKWEDIGDENKGHDDSLFQKYCVQNIKFRSINNIDEWFPKEVSETSPQNSIVVNHEFKDGNNFEQSENVLNSIIKTSATKSSATKTSATLCNETKTDSSLLHEQKNVQRTSTPSSPVPSNESVFNASSLQNRLFSEKTVSNMKKLIKDNPQGLWASEFPAIYKEYFKVPLDYHAYGYVSMAAVAAAYTDVFICLRRSSADFLLFDSESPLPKHYANTANMSSCGVVTEVIKSNVERLIAEFPTGLPIVKFKEMYKLYFSEELNEGELGFSSLHALLQTLHEEFILRLRQVGKNILLYPARNLDTPQQEPPLCNSAMEYDSAELDTAYPPEVLDPHDNIQRQPLPRFRGDFPVFVSDVTTPSYFSMILYDLRHQLESLMDEIQFFYTTEGEKYKMPHSAICKGLLCIARYESNQEWHRAQICSIKGGMSKIKINYIDYGTVGYVSSEELRFMHRDFARLPVQGIPSRLANIEPAMGEWKTEVSKYFLDLVRDKILMAVIDRSNQDGPISVALVDTSGEDDVHINDQLVLAGYAKFKYDPLQNSPDVSIDGSELKLKNDDFEMNKWKSNDQEFTNGDNSCLVPSTVTAPAYDNGKELLPFSQAQKNVPPQKLPAVSIEPELYNNFEITNWKSDGKSFHEQTLTNSDNSSYVSSTVKVPTCNKWKGPVSFTGAIKDVKNPNVESEKKCWSEATNLTGGSANAWYEKAVNKSSSGTKWSETELLSTKEDSMKVWGESLIIPTPINSGPSISSEGDASLALKKIPNTWKDVKYSEVFDSDRLKKNNRSTQLGSKMQTCDAEELPSRDYVSQLSGSAETGNNHTTFLPDNRRNQSPHSGGAPSNNAKDTSFAHHGLYAHNMWNLGNISVSPAWISSGSNPIVNSVSSLVQAGQATWFHQVQNTPQFPLTPVAGVTPIPPPGFTPIQNPFVAFTTPQLPVVDPRLSILDGAFVYQHQSNPWISRFGEIKSTPNQRSFSNSAGPFFTGHNNSEEFVSPTPDIREITESTENLLSLEDCNARSEDAEQELESSRIPVNDHEVKPCGISQCTQTTLDEEVLEDTLAYDVQSSERVALETITETINGSDIDGNKETNVAGDYIKKHGDGHKLPDICMISENGSEETKNAGSCVLTERDSESIEKIDVESVLSRSLQRLEVVSTTLSEADSSLGSTTVPERKLSWVTQSYVENDKQHSHSTETYTRDEEEITRYVAPQEVDVAAEGKGRQAVRYIKKIMISGRVLNLINYNEQAYFCTDEFVRSFSKFSGRHVLLKILESAGITLPFVEVNRSDYFEMFQMLDNCDLNTKSRKPNGQIHDVLHLVPLRSATELLKALKVSDVAIISGLMEEVENFNPDDDYWYRD